MLFGSATLEKAHTGSRALICNARTAARAMSSLSQIAVPTSQLHPTRPPEPVCLTPNNLLYEGIAYRTRNKLPSLASRSTFEASYQSYPLAHIEDRRLSPSY
jgi:hypothetical protein